MGHATRADAGTCVGGRYRLEELIGTGGMGDVWRAHDTILERDVALKLLKHEIAADPGLARLIEREARQTAALSDPGVPTVYDYGVHDSLPYLAMELVRGEPLSERLRREGKLADDVVIDVVARTAASLDAAHRAGLVHCDVKPSNLIVTGDGGIKLMDFGVARRAVADTPVTEAVDRYGTVGYMSPERARGEPTTPASDVYSLGVVAYELLTGHRPFEGEPAAVLLAHVSDEPPPLPDTVNPELRAVVTSALAKRPEDRPSSALELAGRLRDIDLSDPHTRSMPTVDLPVVIDGPSTTVMPATVIPASAPQTDVMPSGARAAPPAAPAARLHRRHRRSWWPIAAIAALVVLALLFAGIAASSDDDPTIAPTGSTVPATPPPTLVPPTLVTVDAAALLGQPVDAVRDWLVAQGLVIEQIDVAGTGAEAGTVVEITPSGEVPAGSTVTLGVAEPELAPPADGGGPSNGKGKGKDNGKKDG